MKSFRIVAGIFTILPLAIIADSLRHPANYGTGSLGKMAYLVFGVPILTFNFWAWMQPEVIEFYLLEFEKEVEKS